MIALAVVLALAGYAVIVELGVTAGRIHPRVSVAGIDVGGLTEADALKVVAERGRDFRDQTIRFETEGLTFELTPGEVGWFPDARGSVRQAHEVGRSGNPIEALVKRGRAWLFGVRIPFAGKPQPLLVRRLVLEWERLGAAAGISIDRGKLRFKIRRALRNHRQDLLRIPLVDGR